MPLDLRLSPSRDAYPAPWREAKGEDLLSPGPVGPSSGMPTSAISSTAGSATDEPSPVQPSRRRPPGAPGPWHQLPSVASGPEARIPVLHSAIDLQPVAIGEATHQFAAWLTDADTLVVPADACLRGNFSAPSVLVKGVVHGRLVATRGPMVIDQGATVHGQVEAAGTLVIAGHVLGQRPGPAVRAAACLHLGATARVSGNVRYAEVAIYEGARVDGSLMPCP